MLSNHRLDAIRFNKGVAPFHEHGKQIRFAVREFFLGKLVHGRIKAPRTEVRRIGDADPVFLSEQFGLTDEFRHPFGYFLEPAAEEEVITAFIEELLHIVEEAVVVTRFDLQKAAIVLGVPEGVDEFIGEVDELVFQAHLFSFDLAPHIAPLSQAVAVFDGADLGPQVP